MKIFFLTKCVYNDPDEKSWLNNIQHKVLDHTSLNDIDNIVWLDDQHKEIIPHEPLPNRILYGILDHDIFIEYGYILLNDE